MLKTELRTALLVLLCAACNSGDVGFVHADQVTRESVEAVKLHLQEIGRSAADTYAGGDTANNRAASAGQTLRKGRLNELEPCGATLFFEYEHRGDTKQGSAHLKCDPVTAEWNVEQVFLMRSH
jgi:hypothetical protein